MNERLLQFIWQFQYYNKKELMTACGEELNILYQGQFNHHQGPDFLEARIKLGRNIWAGNIELHMQASDWKRHMHSEDPNYKNVILHVVWHEDVQMKEMKMPTLILGDRIPKLLIGQYEGWMKSNGVIPCGASMQLTEEITWTSWKERLFIERLQRKMEMILTHLCSNHFHWEETLWWMIARNFGLVVNTEAFGEMAASIPYHLILKHANSIHQLEAMIFGQAGLLEDDFKDKYPLMLKKEYHFLRTKYGLGRNHIPMHFLRMRPACFPTIRLAQLAMLVCISSQLFSAIVEIEDPESIKNMLSVTANDYWHYHFIFDDTSGYRPKKLGTQMINNIMVNTVVPLLFTYGEYRKEEKYIRKAIDWAGRISAEKNSLTMKFEKQGVPIRNAAESQAMIELKTRYCDHRRCLDCAIGNTIFKKQL